VCAALFPKLIVELGQRYGEQDAAYLEAGAKYGAVEYRRSIFPATRSIPAKQYLNSVARVRIEPIEATYLDGIDIAMAGRPPASGAGFCFWAARSVISTGRTPRDSCARSSAGCAPGDVAAARRRPREAARHSYPRL